MEIVKKKAVNLLLNKIWFAMIIVSILCAGATGRLPQLSSAVMDGAKDAVELSIFLLGSMCAWLGFLRIAEESGLSTLLARFLSPAIDRLFPEYCQDEEIKGKICMNLSANILGLGNAATPLGLAAMKAMANHRREGDAPTHGMILFVVLNTASIQLLPINMAAMRASCGSLSPFSILPQIWMTSVGALFVSVLFCKLAERADPRRLNA